MRKLITVLLALALAVLGGCASGGEEETGFSIAGVRLGDSMDAVMETLGSDYEETKEDGGDLPVPISVWEYPNGMQIIFSGEPFAVYVVSTTTAEIPDSAGDKVGEDMAAVLERYRADYEEKMSRHSEDKLEGWFDIGDGQILIFDTDKDDLSWVNKPVADGDKVEAIHLALWKFFD